MPLNQTFFGMNRTSLTSAKERTTGTFPKLIPYGMAITKAASGMY